MGHLEQSEETLGAQRHPMSSHQQCLEPPDPSRTTHVRRQTSVSHNLAEWQDRNSRSLRLTHKHQLAWGYHQLPDRWQQTHYTLHRLPRQIDIYRQVVLPAAEGTLCWRALCIFGRHRGSFALPSKAIIGGRWSVIPHRILVFLAAFVLAVPTLGDVKSSSTLTEQHRLELIRTFSSDLVYIRTQFPMGKVGLTIKGGKVSPGGDDLNKLLALWGPSVKPGDRAIITMCQMKGDRMRFEINGGPVKKKKWYQ